MKTVYKFQAPRAGDSLNLDLPADAKVVHFGLQNGRPFMWVELNPDAPTRQRTFLTFGTGWKVIDNSQHLGTVITTDGFVWHLFEIFSEGISH